MPLAHRRSSLSGARHRAAAQFVDRAKIAPMMRRGFVERRFEIVAEVPRRARLRNPAAPSPHRSVAARDPDPQDAADRRAPWLPPIRRCASRSASSRAAALLLGAFGRIERVARVRRQHRARFGVLARFIGGVFGGAHIGCGGCGFQRRPVEAALRFLKLRARCVSASAEATSRVRSWLDLLRVPFGEFGRQPFERRVRAPTALGQFRCARLCFGQFIGGTRARPLRVRRFRRRIVPTRPSHPRSMPVLAGEVLLGLRDALAQALRILARAALLGIERIALDDKAMQCGRTLALRSGAAAAVRSPLRPARWRHRRAIRAFADRGGCSRQVRPRRRGPALRAPASADNAPAPRPCG